MKTVNVRGYTRRDGRIVRGHNRVLPLVFGHGANNKPEAWHRKRGEHGGRVPIYHATQPTPLSAFADPSAIATVVPGGKVPEALNGVPFRPWRAPTDHDGWVSVDGWNPKLEPYPLEAPFGFGRSAGAVILEPDGRVWVVHPTNQFGGYEATFPKGGADDNLPLQVSAIKEAWEESGLKVELTGFLGDVVRTTSVTRYFLARRVGGSPSDMGWESQAVSLVPVSRLAEVLETPQDHQVVGALLHHLEHGEGGSSDRGI